MFSRTTFVAALSALTFISGASALPTPDGASTSASSGYWLANVDHSQDTVFGNTEAGYDVFRDVKKYGAVGDGTTDDTAAIQKAILDKNRCGWPEGSAQCNSSTTSPAIIYFPAGTYLIKKALNLAYYTQVIGDPTNLPTLKASSDFSGMAVLDADPYKYDAPVVQQGKDAPNWFTNQNNFFRQIRNFHIDLTAAPNGAGIHWQVAQATSIQNVIFDMSKDPNTKQVGIFMDNGSGGWFSDLVFNGGFVGAFLGSQQFTSRNLVFNNCQTAIYMNWNWGWTLNNVTINGGQIGVDMTSGNTNQTVGSVVLSDSKIGSAIGVNTSFKADASNAPHNGGTLIVDNVDFSGTTKAAIWSSTAQKDLVQDKQVKTFAQGAGYDQSVTPVTSRQQVLAKGARKSPKLLTQSGKIFSREKPQYATLPSGGVKAAKKDGGCKGDGISDDTTCIQNFLNGAAQSQALAYFEHGHYLVKNTVTVPSGSKIVGEIWPHIVADSASFSDGNNLKAVFAIGKNGDSGTAEISDMLFSNNGPVIGAKMIEWNLNCVNQGDCGMWDSHVRIGGSFGTNQQADKCQGWPTTSPSPQCYGAGLMFHATKSSGGVYLENTWFWVADHDMEVGNQTQTSIYNPRGALFQSQQGPAWLWGTASEHSMYYNYQIDGVSQGFFGGFMQTETPYFQPNPLNPAPLNYNSDLDDPTFTICKDNPTAAPCKVAWGMRIVNSQNVLIYSTGMYSFFQAYSQTCTAGDACQLNMIRLQGSQVDLYAVTTKAAVNMIVDDKRGDAPIKDADNRDNFGATLAYYFTG